MKTRMPHRFIGTLVLLGGVIAVPVASAAEAPTCRIHAVVKEDGVRSRLGTPSEFLMVEVVSSVSTKRDGSNSGCPQAGHILDIAVMVPTFARSGYYQAGDHIALVSEFRTGQYSDSVHSHVVVHERHADPSLP